MASFFFGANLCFNAEKMKSFLKEGKYLCVRLTNDTKILSFSLGQDAFEPDEKVSLLLTMKRNEFKGEESLDLMAERAI